MQTMCRLVRAASAVEFALSNLWVSIFQVDLIQARWAALGLSVWQELTMLSLKCASHCCVGQSLSILFPRAKVCQVLENGDASSR